MADADVKPIDAAAVQQLVTTTDAVVREALEVASKRTGGGKNIDDEQVHSERLAYAATEVAAARDLVAYAQGAALHGDPSVTEMAAVFSAEVAQRLMGNIDAHTTEFGR
jgi:alkylation response protein AidB-like acyl-CoA dehydrogenase